jgi:sulfate adenylyltransferase subunit 1 (EFTu-like GTPase family)
MEIMLGVIVIGIIIVSVNISRQNKREGNHIVSLHHKTDIDRKNDFYMMINEVSEDKKSSHITGIVSNGLIRSGDVIIYHNKHFTVSHVKVHRKNVHIGKPGDKVTITIDDIKGFIPGQSIKSDK